MRRRGGVLVVACAAAVVVLLAGCGGSTDTGPSPTPLTSSATSSSASASPTASPSPTLDPNSDAAIIAAVHAYVAGYTDSVRTLTLAPLKLLATPTCNCLNGPRQLIDQLTSNTYTTNASFFAENVVVVARSNGRARAKFTVANRTYQVFDSTHRLVGTAPAGSAEVTLDFMIEGSQWIAYLSE